MLVDARRQNGLLSFIIKKKVLVDARRQNGLLSFVAHLDQIAHALGKPSLDRVRT